MSVRTFVLDADASEEELLDVIGEVNENDGIHGCLMFRPLPAHIDETRVCNELSVHKDIDGITRASLASVFTGAGEGFPPATAQACFSMLDHHDIRWRASAWSSSVEAWSSAGRLLRCFSIAMRR